MSQNLSKNGYYTNCHSCYLLQYHIVLVTKYRKPVLTGKVKQTVYDAVQKYCNGHSANILEINGEPDHIHLLVELTLQDSLASFIGGLKSSTARAARRLYGNNILRKFYWKPYFWTAGYFVATVSENSLSVVKAYIQNQ